MCTNRKNVLIDRLLFDLWCIASILPHVEMEVVVDPLRDVLKVEGVAVFW